jgi:hypothetical protein
MSFSDSPVCGKTTSLLISSTLDIAQKAIRVIRVSILSVDR